jgi:hypothetical protein
LFCHFLLLWLSPCRCVSKGIYCGFVSIPLVRS